MILRILRNTDQSIWRYVWKASLLALIPSIVISIGVTLAMPAEGPDLAGPAIQVVCGILIISPWLETLIMWLVLIGLKRFITGQTRMAAASAILWGMLHSLVAPVWGLVVAWPFFVFSICFLAWEKKSRVRAILATGLTHTCQNILPVIALLAIG